MAIPNRPEPPPRPLHRKPPAWKLSELGMVLLGIILAYAMLGAALLLARALG